ncbi:MAG TPA: DUF4388 domain-containing protein [Anaeromyxobacteraceae bacterium]|nr:DUF4388 domain-containing protein [Anaeromyxobacteraceae bacterium]
MRGLMGSFAVLPLPDLLGLLGSRRLGGALTFERGTVRKTLLLADGVAVGASSNDPREHLGQLLINFGHLGEEELQRAFQAQEGSGVRLGQVLVAAGLVTPETVREALAIKVRETALDVFRWGSGFFTFDDAPPPPPDPLDAAVPLAGLVEEAEFRATAWSAFRGEFPSGAAALEVDEARVPPGLAPGTVDGRLLALARDGLSIDEIGLALHATDFHLYQRLYALARQGIVRPAPARVLGGTEAPVDAGELVDRARALLAGGRAAEAEQVAAMAVELAPASEPARLLLAEASRRLGEGLRAALLEPPRVPRPLVTPAEIAGLRRSSVDKYLLSRCDGRRTVRQLVQIAPLEELDVLKALSRLAEAGLVELVAGEPGAGR